jgi:threonine dehydratase
LLKCPPINGLRRIYIKDESVNPTGTFKDRLIEKAMATSGVAATLAAISYGNTALSLAFHLERLRLRDARTPAMLGCVLVPPGLKRWSLGPSTNGTMLSGGDLIRRLKRTLEVVEIGEGSGVLTDADVEAVVHSRLPMSRTVVNLTEGLDTPAYVDIAVEAVEQLGVPPDVCLVPFGAGILCNETRDYLSRFGSRVVALSVARPDSLARMLYGPYWVDVDELWRTGVALSRHGRVDRTGAVRVPYSVYRVDESDIELGLERATAIGLSAEPSGVVGLGFLDRLPAIGVNVESDPLILVINTGNGIDRFESLHSVSADCSA